MILVSANSRKMTMNVYNLTWKHFGVNQDRSLKEIFSNNENADVTLVSGDKVAFLAHKFVLSACSTVLKDLLLSNPHPHPMIYLNGVKKIELDSLLQFMYLGKTQICQSRMEKFFENGRDLHIKQLKQTLVKTNESTAKNVSVIDDCGDKSTSMKDDCLIRDDFDGERDYSVDKEAISIKSYSCEKCETKVFNSMRELTFHRKKRT